jgi:uncharacterized membrane protein
MKKFLRQLVTTNTGVSSKRVCGILGWLVCLFICVWCTLTVTIAPAIVETLFICSTSLLGVDSLVKIIRGYYPQSNNKTEG